MRYFILELLTIKEIAEFLRCSTRAIHKWTRLKNKPLPVLYAGRKPLFQKDAVLDWLKARNQNSQEVSQ